MTTTLLCEPTELETVEASDRAQERVRRFLPNRKLSLGIHGLYMLACVVAGFLTVAVMTQHPNQNLKWLTATVAAAMLLAFTRQRLVRRSMRKLMAAENRGLAGRYTASIEDAGVRISWSRGEGFYSWDAVSAVEEARTVTLFYLGNAAYFYVPHTAFASNEERAGFIATVRSRIGEPPLASGSKPLDAASADVAIGANDLAGSSTARNAWRSLGRNVIAGIKLSVFMRVGAEDIEASWSQLVALIGVGLAAKFAVDFSEVGLKGHFFPYELPTVLFYVPLALVAAWGMACIARRPERTLTLMIALLASAIPIEVVPSLFEAGLSHKSPTWMEELGNAINVVRPFWLGLAGAIAAVRILAIPFATSASAFVVSAVLLWLPQAAIWHGQLWIKPYTAEARERSRYEAINDEDVFYLQPKLLQRELAGLKRGNKGTIDLYFVGVAGYASQDVFMREVNSVSKLFRERFETQGHTVRLINNANSVAELPIASVTALKATFTRVAEVMDPDEDILFLFLTSHGSKDHHFTLEFGRVAFKTLDPPTLRRLLDESGIKRRVIVVSACYSGGFMDALKDDNSLVITAAAADRSSFGCSDKADFTYFGKAYFDEALRGTYSFVEAFDQAKPRIEAREKEANYDGSNPQMFVGNEIRQPLAALERRLKRHAVDAIRQVSAEQTPPGKTARR